MNNNRTIEILNKLVEINNDRIEGYETAGKETDEQDLKTLFKTLSKTSETNRKELSNVIVGLQGTPTDGTTITGKFFRVWMDVKSALSGKNRKAILESCEYGEQKAVETYDEVLTSDLQHLNTEQKKMVSEQHMNLSKDHQHIKKLCTSLEQTSN